MISLIALFYQSYLAREENRLIQMQQSASVLPYLTQWSSNSGDRLKIAIENKGVGPAFIEKVDIVYDSIHKFDNTDDLFRHIFRSTTALDSVSYATSTFKKGSVLTANEIVDLIKVSDRNAIKTFTSILATTRFEFSIEYSDVYGSKWIISTENDMDVPQLIKPN